MKGLYIYDSHKRLCHALDGKKFTLETVNVEFPDSDVFLLLT